MDYAGFTKQTKIYCVVNGQHFLIIISFLLRPLTPRAGYVTNMTILAFHLRFGMSIQPGCGVSHHLDLNIVLKSSYYINARTLLHNYMNSSISSNCKNIFSCTTKRFRKESQKIKVLRFFTL